MLHLDISHYRSEGLFYVVSINSGFIPILYLWHWILHLTFSSAELLVNVLLVSGLVFNLPKSFGMLTLFFRYLFWKTACSVSWSYPVCISLFPCSNSPLGVISGISCIWLCDTHISFSAQYNLSKFCPDLM